MNDPLDLNQVYPGRRVFGVGKGGLAVVQIPPPEAGSFWDYITGLLPQLQNITTGWLTPDTPFPATSARRRLGAGWKPRVKLVAQRRVIPPPLRP